MNGKFVQHIEKELKTDVRHNKRSIEKIASSYGIYDKNLIKELTELAIVNLCREISKAELIENYINFSLIVDIYKRQVNLSHRTSKSIMFQQYSTPAPISYVGGLFLLQQHKNLCNFKKEKYTIPLCFEPSAGNGLLAIALPYKNTYVNEVDKVRLNNLKTQPFARITNQDATKPFNDYYRKFDCVITNPPFGSLSEAVYYDSYPIKCLDHLMALRVLDTMKNEGSAVIIIGGHTQWDDKNRIQAGKNRIFFNYLYSHYFVSDVIAIDGHSLYSKQGTSFDVRMILINGRKIKTDGVAPLKAYPQDETVYDFDDLYDRVLKEQTIEKFENKEFCKWLSAKTRMIKISNKLQVSSAPKTCNL
ncbi:MAG: hypothetical protein LBQ22_13165 [Bacteroidales bacterium]|jgi:hypothetical protein|nr:hypothetical protein [Bacteroidales bacterium]